MVCEALNCVPPVIICIEYKIEVKKPLMIAHQTTCLRYLQFSQHNSISYVRVAIRYQTDSRTMHRVQIDFYFNQVLQKSLGQMAGMMAQVKGQSVQKEMTRLGWNVDRAKLWPLMLCHHRSVGFSYERFCGNASLTSFENSRCRGDAKADATSTVGAAEAGDGSGVRALELAIRSTSQSGSFPMAMEGLWRDGWKQLTIKQVPPAAALLAIATGPWRLGALLFLIAAFLSKQKILIKSALKESPTPRVLHKNTQRAWPALKKERDARKTVRRWRLAVAHATSLLLKTWKARMKSTEMHSYFMWMVCRSRRATSRFRI